MAFNRTKCAECEGMIEEGDVLIIDYDQTDGTGHKLCEDCAESIAIQEDRPIRTAKEQASFNAKQRGSR